MNSLRELLLRAFSVEPPTKPSPRAVEKALRRVLGLSKRDAQRAIHYGYADLKLTPAETRDVEALAARLDAERRWRQ